MPRLVVRFYHNAYGYSWRPVFTHTTVSHYVYETISSVSFSKDAISAGGDGRFIESSSGQDVVVEWSMGDRRVVKGRVASVTISSP